jgi:ABC-2 type transport system ATP-binding protein
MSADTTTTTDGRPTLRLRDYRVRKYVPDLVVETDFPAGVNLLLGVNGVGKTTILRSLVHPGLRAAGSTADVCRGQLSRTLQEERVCLLPQKPTTPGQLTVVDLIRYCCHLRGVHPDCAQEVLERLGLGALADRKAARLSGGETQRLHLALAFVGDPAVALLDEPTVALDPLARSRFAELMRTLTTAETIIVMSSHVASDIDIADRIYLIAADRIAWAGSPTSFLEYSPRGQFDDAFGRLLREATS